MKNIAEVSNQNLVRNSDAYLSSGGKNDPDNELKRINDSYKLSKEEFQLTYSIFRWIAIPHLRSAANILS